MEALISILRRYQRDVQAHTGAAVVIECAFEAGYDGFWLHRRLAQVGIAYRIMDPASLKVDRRARRVKTDRVDAECLLRALQSWRRGDRQACAFVGVPSIEEEDARQPYRELARLRKEPGEPRESNKGAARPAWRPRLSPCGPDRVADSL